MSDRFLAFHCPAARARKPVDHNLATQNLSVSVWRPGWFSIRPRGLTQRNWLLWWLLDRLGVFKSGIYRALVIYAPSGEPAFWGAMFPAWWRRPFLNASSVEIGNINVPENFRRRGLGILGVQLLMAEAPADIETIYYLCRVANIPSIKLAEHCGFERLGTVRRTPNGLLGRYRLLLGEAADNASLTD